MLLLACNTLMLSACNESTEIEVLTPTPSVNDEGGGDIEFTQEQLKLPSKKGACFTLRDNNYIQNMARVETLKAGWNYSWGADYVSNQLPLVEFVPMAWGGANDVLVTKIKGYVNEGKCKRILGFNEPDGKDQANMTVEKAIELWPLLESLKIPLGSPAVVDAENGEWLQRFMDEAKRRAYRVDYLCVHNYGGGSATEFKRKLTAIYEKYKLPILITEFAVADWTATKPEDNKHSVAKILQFMKDILPWLESTPFIYGYSWFSFGQTSAAGCTSALFDDNNQLTELGKYYAAFPNVVEPPVESQNLLLNPGFEEGGANWTGVSNVNYDNKTVNTAVEGNIISGNVTLRFSAKTAFADISQSVRVEKGKTYKFGFTGRIQEAPGPEGSESLNRSFKMVVRKDKDNVYASTNTITGSTNVIANGEVTIGDNFPESIQVYISKSSGIAYIDDVFFKEVVK